MSTSALFPVSLYQTDATIEDNTLTLSEWQQTTVEIEAVEKGLSPSTAAGGGTAGLYALKFIQGGSTATGGLMVYVATDGHLAWRSSADVFLSVTKSLAVNSVAGGVTGLTGLSFVAGGSTASGGLQLYTATDGRLSWRDSADTLLPLQRGLTVNSAAGGVAGLTGLSFVAGGSTATGGLQLYTATDGMLSWRDSADVRLPLQKGLTPSTAAGGSTAAVFAIAFTQGGSTATGGLMLYVDTDGYLAWRSSADVTFRLAPPS